MSERLRAEGEGDREESYALKRECTREANRSEFGTGRMEIRPDRFKIVAGKTLGKLHK